MIFKGISVDCVCIYGVIVVALILIMILFRLHHCGCDKNTFAALESILLGLTRHAVVHAVSGTGFPDGADSKRAMTNFWRTALSISGFSTRELLGKTLTIAICVGLAHMEVIIEPLITFVALDFVVMRTFNSNLRDTIWTFADLHVATFVIRSARSNGHRPFSLSVTVAQFATVVAISVQPMIFVAHSALDNAVFRTVSAVGAYAMLTSALLVAATNTSVGQCHLPLTVTIDLGRDCFQSENSIRARKDEEDD